MRLVTVAQVIGVVTCALWPTALQAEDGGHGSVNPVQVDFWQAGFTILVFVLLVLVLSRVAFRPILKGLQQRESFIRESLDAARRDREAAETRLREYEERLHRAREEASAIVEEGRRDAEVVRKRIGEEARLSGDNMLDRAKREIGIARDTALKSLYEESASLAASLASAALKRQLSPEEHQRLVLDALRELADRPNSPN